MIALGIALLATGVVLLVAEAHVTSGVLGVLGAIAAVAGVVLAATGADGGIALTLVLAVVVAAAAAAYLVLAARAVGGVARRRVRTGREALIGACGEARTPMGELPGRVFVDGALWRARAANPEEQIQRRGAGRRRARRRPHPHRPPCRNLGADAMTAVLVVLAVLVALLVVLAGASVRVLREYERGRDLPSGPAHRHEGAGADPAGAGRSTAWSASGCAP